VAESRQRRRGELRDDEIAFAIVAIGASAGGLEACIGLLEAMPDEAEMAFILVQHLDPNHESMLVNLLASHTALEVLEAGNGMRIERGHIYIIPRGTYLAISQGALVLSAPGPGRSVRMPFDVLLTSLADHSGSAAACVVLSGTGTDGSLGLCAIKAKGGKVIVQLPEEAAYDGMPRSAIATGAVDRVLPVSEIPAAIVEFARQVQTGHPQPLVAAASSDVLADIIALLRTRKMHDFAQYKRGTLQRRVERRMGMAGLAANEMDRYLDLLRGDRAELDLLADDMMIHVTSFFRDKGVFALLESTIVPEVIRAAAGQTLRIWIPGCSTGQETYSIAMLFLEQMAAAGSLIRLQVFASDADPAAVARAREGLYAPDTAAQVSPERLARFFSAEEHGYRVHPFLRETIVFAVQDVLADPPFSRLDMISCRNLLIYLQPDAQARILSLFHFALREGGILLLGTAETVAQAEGLFEPVSMSDSVYRRIRRSSPAALGLLRLTDDGLKLRAAGEAMPVSARQSSMAESTRQRLLETFAPASVLINRNHECLFSAGPTDRFLRVPPGHQTNDLLAMARLGVRSKLKSAVRQALADTRRIFVGGGRMWLSGRSVPFGLDVQPIAIAGEDLLLVCFVEQTAIGQQETSERAPPAAQNRGSAQIAELEEELYATTNELQTAVRDLEHANEKQKAIHEDALSVNEEFQSANEELLTSKEELQSLNEELTVLNSQLQSSLERQRTMSDDLQNVLYSTDVATLFLDSEFRIRFFTPATKALFSIIDADVGRPLADLRPLAADGDLLTDARAVLATLTPIERETMTRDGAWFMRWILPYRGHDQQVGGVVITFTDITERRRTASALDAAKQHADLANREKSRFLAAASHDLRQPLQTLSLLHGLLIKSVGDERSRKLVVRQGETIHAMSGMLNTLLDINQIDAGVVQATLTRFPINDLLLSLRDEFSYHAQARGLNLRMVPCSLLIESDPRLLEQMLRNLLTNAMKYTAHGSVLLGCRRLSQGLSIQIWDTGIGIPDDRLQDVFEEYVQIDNPARERARGLGLGLSIVQRLGRLLGHAVTVRSSAGRGSVFSIEVSGAKGHVSASGSPGLLLRETAPAPRTGVILVVEDDPDLREALQLFLQDEGHLAATTRDGYAALDLVTRGTIRPDLILADYNLPNGFNGVQLALRVRETTAAAIQAIILTGDISAAALRHIEAHDLPHLAKPVRLDVLTRTIQRLLPASRGRRSPRAQPEATPVAPLVIVVDDDAQFCAATRSVLQTSRYGAEIYSSGEAYWEAYRPDHGQCLLIDGHLPGMSGIALLERLRQAGSLHPAIVMTGQSDVPMVVKAMKAGAFDFIEKPIATADLLGSIGRALELAEDSLKRTEWKANAASQINRLTPRERQILTLVLAGHANKIIAADLGVSQRTVEYHRAAIMRKTGAGSLPALARLAVAASGTGGVGTQHRAP
jgi:two-component system CheB/CheR fusion protein